jgi:anaerobic selenocysteine-containing dehydrogenase
LADYVLPSSTQFEKAEATFFNFDFPENYFQLRPRLLEAAPGTLPEAEIHARLCEALGVMPDLAPLRAAAKQGRAAYAQALMMHVMPDPKLTGLAPVLLYRTMELADDVREGAVLFGLALQLAMRFPASLERAGFGGAPLEQADRLFSALLENPSGVVFAIDEWAEVKKRIGTPEKKVRLHLPDLLAELDAIAGGRRDDDDPEFPFVLSAGERRSFTANTIIRDAAWRKKDAQGALRIHPDDAAALGVTDGGNLRLTTRRDSVVVAVELSDRMRRGHVSLPNGLGLTSDGGAAGIAPNELTASADRDPFVGTPWHKHVRARLEAT